MGFELKKISAYLDDKQFDAHQEVESAKHFFGNRIDNVGILYFGFVLQGKENQISLAANGIKSPIIIDSIICFAPNIISDEIYFRLYTTYDGRQIKLGTQKFTNSEMPINYPTNIVFPDMIIGVEPTKADSTVILYAKPVKILFQAVSDPS